MLHGKILINGRIFFNDIAYISDCNKIPKKSIKNLYNLSYLIIDCLRMKKHPLILVIMNLWNY